MYTTFNLAFNCNRALLTGMMVTVTWHVPTLKSNWVLLLFHHNSFYLTLSSREHSEPCTQLQLLKVEWCHPKSQPTSRLVSCMHVCSSPETEIYTSSSLFSWSNEFKQKTSGTKTSSDTQSVATEHIIGRMVDSLTLTPASVSARRDSILLQQWKSWEGHCCSAQQAPPPPHTASDGRTSRNVSIFRKSN